MMGSKISIREGASLSRTMRNVWMLVRDRKWTVAGIIVLVSSYNILNSLVGLIFREITNLLTGIPVQSGFINFIFSKANDCLTRIFPDINLLITLAAFMVFLALVNNSVLSYFKEVCSNVFLIKLENKFPVIVHKKYMTLSVAYHQRNNIGDKVTRIVQGYEKLSQSLGDLFIAVIPQFLFLAFNFALIAMMDWQLALCFGAAFLPAGYLNYYCKTKYGPLWESVAKKRRVRGGIFGQSLLNIKVVKQYNQMFVENAKVAVLSNEIERVDAHIIKRVNLYYSVIAFLINFFFYAAILWGGWKVYHGRLDIGALVFIFVTGRTMFHFLWMMVYIFVRFMKNMASVDEVLRVLEEKPEIKSAKEAKDPDRFEDRIRFENVAFAYHDPDSSDKGDNDIFRDLNLEIEAGKKTAVVGLSGVGKSTLLSLLSRFYDVKAGRICLDGVDIRQLKITPYNRLFANVMQEPSLFDATIRENICFPCRVIGDEERIEDNASDEEIREALLEAGLKEMLSLRQGLNTRIGEQGLDLSGGQRQRLALARAILAVKKGAQILILDESTANIDPETEKTVSESINRLRERYGLTVIAVAHRLATIRDADKIIVLENGCLIEEGSHAELVAQNGQYAEFVKKQSLN